MWREGEEEERKRKHQTRVSCQDLIACGCRLNILLFILPIFLLHTSCFVFGNVVDFFNIICRVSVSFDICIDGCTKDFI